jgi:hypothetical protein
MDFARPLNYTFPLMRGEDVRAVQQALIALRVQPPCGVPDGVFGYRSAAAVRAFQGNYNVAGRVTGGSLPVDGKVDEATWGALFVSAKGIQASSARIQAAAAAVEGPAEVTLPAHNPCLSAAQVQKVRAWMSTHFGPAIAAAVQGTPFDEDLIYAIACQETAPVWLPWIDKMSPDDILARCVFDASGDAENSRRDAFPANTAAFRAHFGDPSTQQLIDEANATRKLRGYAPAQWVYKGYGIFQYDLQNILNDQAFFGDRQWANFGACLERLMRELHEKLDAAHGSLLEAVRRYNGAGPAAELYAVDVMQMRRWSAAVAQPTSEGQAQTNETSVA